MVVVIHAGEVVLILAWESEVAGDGLGSEFIDLAEWLIGRVPDHIAIIIGHHLGRSQVVVVVEINRLGIAQG